MGTFERLSVVVIGVILVMILVVAVATWSEDPTEPTGTPEARTDDLEPDPTPRDRDDPDPWLNPDPSPDPTPDPTPDPEPEPTPQPSPDPLPPGPEPIPGPRPAAARIHVVQPGESGGLIAQKYYPSAKFWPQLRRHNGLESDLIAVGQELEIPTPEELGFGNRQTPAPRRGGGPKPGATWKVQKGEDLPTIAKLAYGDSGRWPDIWIANRTSIDTPDDLPEGTLLTLPE